MKLSAPIHELKSSAKKLKNSQSIPLSKALNSIAQTEGYSSWSLLVSHQNSSRPNSYVQILDYFNPGDGVVVASRPRIGKTNFCIGLLVQAILKRDKKHYFFTLDEVESNIKNTMSRYHFNMGQLSEYYTIDCSDDISSEYIIEKLRGKAESGTVILIDYLQLLDQNRMKAVLVHQVNDLLAFAKESGCIIIFISQINRAVNEREDSSPTIDDINLPNPVDLDKFNKIICLSKQDNSFTVSFKKPKSFDIDIQWDLEKNRFIL